MLNITQKRSFTAIGILWTCGRIALTILVLGAILTGCTTTVKTYNSQWTDSAAELAAEQPQEKRNTLETLSPEQLIQHGESVMRQGNLNVARMYYAMAIKKDPASVAALAGMGALLLQSGVLDGAQAAYEQALELDSNYHSALLDLARIHRLQGNIDTAKALLNRALEVDPEQVETLNELAMTYDAAGEVNVAAPLYDKIVQLSPQLAASHNNQGFNRMLQGDYPRAVSSFRKALTLEPDNLYALNNLAAAFALLGDEERALRLFTSASSKAVAYNNVGYLKMTRGDLEQAEEDFKTALELKPSFYLKAQENLDQLYRMKRLEVN